jgi:uncharacterized protein YoxC
VSVWATVFLGVIAVATLATAIVQIGVLVAASRLARRAERLMDVVEQEVRPILGHLNAIGRDASRAASLATVQVERVDRLFAMLVERLEETVKTIQTTVARPAREAAALVAGLRAALSFIRDFKAGRTRSRADDEDALFI